MRPYPLSSLSISRLPNWVSECSRCANDKHIPKLYSSGNNMDPGVVPTQIQGLTQAEEMFVSAVLPVMSIYKLPHGQYSYSDTSLISLKTLNRLLLLY
uniref:DUF6570 domain-containing protein n=1 Tax=Amphimedon queenslandica TaxID=400682 RepID=A0A1X7SF32_AMPQE